MHRNNCPARLCPFSGGSGRVYLVWSGNSSQGGDQQYVANAFSLSIQKPAALEALQNTDAGIIRIQLPDPLNIQLDLYRTIGEFSSDAMISTSDGRVFAPNPDHQFTGA
ncbi:MAG: hypothetical protein IPP25_18485 [Saprospiraceae bacterium]|nr:hypothetical protein [Candidatus Opimibacter skivensis]